MEASVAVAALSALAHESRLAVFRALVRQGARGLPAGKIGERLGLAPATLSFHLAHLTRASLLRSRREGRKVLYAADYEAMAGLMSYLTENCCQEGGGCEPQRPRTVVGRTVPSRRVTGRRAR